jgi:hypothetical protein
MVGKMRLDMVAGSRAKEACRKGKVMHTHVYAIAKLWKQPRCPTTKKKKIKKMWCLCTLEFYSATKKERIFVIYK